MSALLYFEEPWGGTSTFITVEYKLLVYPEYAGSFVECNNFGWKIHYSSDA